MKLLMIGGTRDGRYLNVNPKACRFVIPTLESFNSKAEFNPEDKEHEMATFNEEVYTLRRCNFDKDKKIEFLAEEKLTDYEAFVKLIEGYKKGGDNIEAI